MLVDILVFFVKALLVFGLVLFAGGTLIGYWFTKRREFEIERFKGLFNVSKNAGFGQKTDEK